MLSTSSPPTGTVPNLTNPLKMATQVDRLEWKAARSSRKPRTTTILTVMIAFKVS